MTDTHEQTLSTGADAPVKNGAAGSAKASRPAAKRGSLSTMLLPELQQVAGGLGISTAKMKKSDLVAAIQAARSGSSAGAATSSAPAADSSAAAATAPAATAGSTRTRSSRASRAGAPADSAAPAQASAPAEAPSAPAADSSSAPPETRTRDEEQAGRRERRPQNREPQNREPQNREPQNREQNPDQQSREQQDRSNRDQQDRPAQRDAQDRSNRDQNGQTAPSRSTQNGSQNGQAGSGQHNQNGNGSQANQNRSTQNAAGQNGQHAANQNGQNGQNASQNATNQNASQNGASNGQGEDDDDFEGSGRRRGRRYRDRRGRNRERPVGTGQPAGQGGGNDVEPTVTDDDVLVPIAGVVDAQEEKGNWFIRVGGYFATADDVYIANAMVRRYGLRRGDAVTGQVKALREGERREKYNPLVRLDSVNGDSPEKAKNRVEFTKLTPLYPQERLRLETEPHILTTRVIDLVMPMGKGQRALIVSPPKAGKTMVLQAIANAISINNPEAHLMVVLVDERPEEVTDMQRSVKGEVIASTFDRRPQDHITVAELSIERAKRLVEMGHDVVVLLDSITRLGRAYNLGAPASGRILSGGVDSTALYQPKRFLGAARNIENGGSLTIIATALVETGSAGDTVFFEEYKGTGNAELKLDRKIADKRIFPAIDVDQSSTRKEEILLSPDELAVTIKLRRVLHALESQQAIELLLDRLRKTRTNIEFLMQIAKTTPGQD